MTQLALFEGAPVRKKPFHPWPVHDTSEEKALIAAVNKDQWWYNHCGSAAGYDVEEAKHSEVVQFQREFADYHGTQYGVACANGTAALEIAMKALGVKPGDEVICPAYSFVATSNAVLQVNGIPVFIDIEEDTYNIDVSQIEGAITDKTVGIIPVHFGGQAPDMEKILSIAKKHGLFVLEDAAHGHGGKWRDQYLGSIGDAATFSFQASKNMTAGEGGIITTNNQKLAEKMESLVWCGRRHDAPWYEFFDLGWNYRLTEFQGAILRCQLKRLEEQTARRDANAQYLIERLFDLPGLLPVKRMDDTTIHTQHVFMMRYDEKAIGVPRTCIHQALEAEGLPVSTGYAFSLFDNPMYLQQKFWNSSFPVASSQNPHAVDFASYRIKCPVSERACKSEALWLPQNVFLGTKEDMDDIYLAFEKVLKSADALQKYCQQNESEKVDGISHASEAAARVSEEAPV